MQQLAWYEAANESILATVVIDTDEEFSGIILARDLRERFRWVNATEFFDTPEQAAAALHGKVAEVAAEPGAAAQKGR